ncbi:Myosin-10, related [Eimeria acervulina]|uniref:Myosin-10, related n=1 Tax=Eimeria acervulina TaxID=5801 RepID=U6GKT8_EIMAC|nr:Myosin-10, related [Eimeria acervulina]CDI80841.1 Myosin-10, related [Eimeria acervulina]
MLGTGSPGFTGDGRIIPAPEANLNTPTGVQVADQGQGQPEEVTGRCSDGYYCPEGSSKTNAVACPPGHFCKALESLFTNVALGADVEPTISGDFVGSGTPDKVTNGDIASGTGWVSKNTSGGGHGLTVDFGDLFFINEVTVISGTAEGKDILSSFSVHYFHSASSTYVELFSVASNKESTYSLSFGEVATRKIMLSTTESQVYLSEIQVSGTSSPGSAAPTPCPYGWYQDLKAQMACKICPEGYFCQDSTVAPTSKCHAGYYCPKGSYTGYENPCPLGTYNNVEGAKAISECLPCPIGKYCGSRGLAHPTGECFAGYYCKGGAWSPAPHPEENNPDGISGPAGSLCPIGYYCPEGTQSPQPCQEGARTDLLPLYVFGEDNDDYGLCPVGHYCPSGSATPTPCARGTFQDPKNLALRMGCQAGGVLLGGTALPAALSLAHALQGSTLRSLDRRNADPVLRDLSAIC